jgi:hypothetical protein
MDPLSVIGAAAAAAQLLAQGITISKFLSHLYSKANEAPEIVQKQIAQIEQLIGLARLITQNPALQNEAVAGVVRECMKRAEAFQDVLTKISAIEEDGKVERVRKAFAGLMKEKEIIKLSEDLERQKSLLTLAIQAIDSWVQARHSRDVLSADDHLGNRFIS